MSFLYLYILIARAGTVVYFQLSLSPDPGRVFVDRALVAMTVYLSRRFCWIGTGVRGRT